MSAGNHAPAVSVRQRMTSKFALFPLQLVVFPGEQLNLHIFEPRYRQLIEDADATGRTWLVPTIIEGEMRPTATEVTLSEIAMRYPTGEYDVRTKAGSVYFLDDFWETLPGKLYPGGIASELDIDLDENPSMNEEIIGLAVRIYQKLKVKKKVRSVEEGFTTFDIGHYVGLTLEQEYQMLTKRSAYPRQKFLLDHLSSILPDVERNTHIRERAELNGHFKELVPPNF